MAVWNTQSFWGDFDFLYQLLLVMVKSSFLIILTMMWISATFPQTAHRPADVVLLEDPATLWLRFRS